MKLAAWTKMKVAVCMSGMKVAVWTAWNKSYCLQVWDESLIE